MELKNRWRHVAAPALALVVVVAALTSKANAADGTHVPAPVISPPGGLFTNATVVIRITGATNGIRYTLDGTVPATNSPLYVGPLTVSNSCYLQARAMAMGAPPGEV